MSGLRSPSALASALVCMLLLPTAASGAPAQQAAVIGNGALTAGIDGAGWISVLRWPGPTSADHIPPTTEGLPALADGMVPFGAGWVAVTAGRAYPVGYGPWQAAAFTVAEHGYAAQAAFVLPEADLVARLQWRVHPERDMLYARIQIEMLGEGSAAPPNVYWYSPIAPRTRMAPEIGLPKATLAAQHGMVCFYDPETSAVIHARPERAGRAQWDLARALARRHPLEADWSALGAGAWIGIAPKGELRGFQCGLRDRDSAALAQIAADALDGAARSVGHPDAAIHVPTERDGARWTGEVCIACAPDLAALRELLATRRADPAEPIAAAAAAWLADAAQSQDASIAAVQRLCLTGLRLGLDRGTGAMATRPGHGDREDALCLPVRSAWAVQALALAGCEDEAEQLLRFLARAATGDEMTNAAGASVPSRIYGNATPAVPREWTDLRANAAFLWAAHACAARLAPEQRSALLTDLASALTAVVQRIAAWRDPQSGLPVASFDADSGRFRSRPDDAYVVDAALDHAAWILEALGQPSPERFAGPGAWPADRLPPPPLAAWACSDELTSYPPHDVLESRLRDAAQRDRTAQLEALCEAVICAADDAAIQKQVRAGLRQLAESWRAEDRYDPYRCALFYIASARVFP